MEKIEKELVAYHQEMKKTGQVEKEIEEYEINKERQRQIEAKQEELRRQNEELKRKQEEKKENAIVIPYCHINTVIDNSPAFKGGIF
jgi:hypothetical protein